MKAIGIETGTIENKQLTSSLKANGVLQVPNQNKASISSVYSGVVKSLLVQPGNSVTKDQIIATIANPEFIQSQEEYLSLAPKIVLAEQEYSRQKELNEGNAGALKNLQAADAQLKALKTRKAALASQIQLMGINPQSLTSDKLNSVLAIRSPIAGVVSDVVVKIGSFVSNGTSIADIVDNSHLHVDLFVYEKDLSKLRENQVIHFTLTNNPGKEYDAEIYSLGSSFEGESKAVTVHAQVNGNKTGLIDGMNITAVISLDKNTAPAVPSDAIVTQQGQDYIFIVTGESEKPEKMVTFEKVPVAKGTTDVGYTAITLLKQIPVETKVVTKGAFFVLAKMTNTGEHEE
ncbi:efflux RND transporter periplasmic adaptor subunit [Parasegetibacter sp. MAH-26]|uniref:Efflux RND transporter periplasmic adaptor subunit n=1 Tax=Pinibacter aurantiacus TaxID=2851599 RepID=A0A9E2S546_9BACT|nr:efflux RND transporter periplasmic adaptor subunit [Pinibacter aurantiacus]